MDLAPPLSLMLKNWSLAWVKKQNDETISNLCNYFVELAHWLRGDETGTEEKNNPS